MLKKILIGVGVAVMDMDMDKMIGADFERGLAGIKTAAEAAPKAMPSVATAP